jgi:ABC-type uncharacterized transport system permease subunit
MAEMSVIWLRVAAVLYSVGLLHAIVTLVRRREQMFRPALGAFALAVVFHFVSIMEHGLAINRCPVTNFHETLSMGAFLLGVLFLFVHWRYRAVSLGTFIFPLVFMMALVSAIGNPVAEWASPEVRNFWLTGHIVLVLLGYAALVFTSVAAALYLAQERELKRKKPRKLSYRLPPLATLDDVITKFMALGFAFITVAIVFGTMWAFMDGKTEWLSDPKIVVAFVTWGVYLAMVFFRVTAGWRGRKAALMAVVALGFSAITWIAHARLGAQLLEQ